MQKLATLIALVALTSVASAATSTIVSDANSFTGYVVNEISIDVGTSEWVTAELIVLPDANGLIYQGSYSYDNPVPPFIPPTITIDPWASDQYQATIDYYTQLEYDSRIANGVFVQGAAESAYSTLSAPAGATKHLPTVADGTDEIRVTWYTLEITETGALDMAMVTLDDEAGGTWSFRAFDVATGSEIACVDLSGPIVDGVLLPEPATMLMLIGGGLGLVMRRRK